MTRNAVVRRGSALVWIRRARPSGRIRGDAIPCGWCIARICCYRDGRWRGDGGLVRRRLWLTGNGGFGVGAPSSIGILAHGALSGPAKVDAVHAPLEVVHGVRIRTIRATYWND